MDNTKETHPAPLYGNGILFVYHKLCLFWEVDTED